LPISSTEDAAKLLSKTKYIRMDEEETEEILKVMATGDPERLDFRVDTQLDLSKYSKLEIVDLDCNGSTVSKLLPKIFASNTVRIIYIDTQPDAITKQNIGEILNTFPGWKISEMEDIRQIVLQRTPVSR
jgi:hypothetical protein